jgi:hypothetical protein
MAPFQWAIYIGPPWHDAASPYYFDWPSYGKDAASNLNITTTLASTLASGANLAVLTSAASFPSKGGLWLGPNGSGQSWEYCEYTGKSTNNLTGLTREPTVDRDHNGVHTAGAAAYLWWKLAETDGNLNINFALDDLSVASDWQFEISGIKAPQAAFQPLHVAIIQYRQDTVGTMTNLLVGFMDSSSIRDDARSTRGWSARFGSIGLLLRRSQVEGVRVGNFDLAVTGQATSTIPLAAPHKERWTGDFTPANPNFDASIVLQEEDDGIWIGDRLIGTSEDPADYSGISQIYINPPASLNAGTKWFEFIWKDTDSTEMIAYDGLTGITASLRLPSYEVHAGERVIVAENATVFLRENPTQEALHIFDVSGSSQYDFFNRLQPVGGGLAFNFFGSYSGGVFWGNVTPDIADFAGGWVGPSLPSPKVDETMRWKALDNGHANTKDDWEVSMRQSPGYRIHNNTRGEQAWLAVVLPGMGLILHDDITTTSPLAGQFLAIDGQNGPSTDGLANPGDLVVGDEVIRYINKTATGVTVSERGAYGTAVASHKASDAVFVFHTQNGRLSVTDAMPIREVSWERPVGSTNYPRDFNWRYSALPARTPDAEQHEDDYEFYQPVTDYTMTGHQITLAQARVKTILLEFKRMSADPSRPRINRLKALVDESYFDSSLWLQEGASIEQLMQRILLNAGLSSGAIQIPSNGVAPTGFTTAIDMAWNVIASAAELGNSMIKIDRDSKVILQPDNLWRVPVGTYTPFRTWTRSNAGNVEYSRNAGGAVSQVKLHWKLPDGSDSGVAKYPSSPAALGGEQNLGPLYFATSGDADLAARKRYYLSRYPYELVVSLAQGDITVEPHQIHRVQWLLAEDGTQIDRYILVRQVQHTITSQLLATVLHGVIIDQEWEV